MLVSHKHKLVIFTLERTASQSIHSSLEHLFDVSIDGPRYRHLNALDFDRIILPFLDQQYYKIAIFRDPIERCTSLYKRYYEHNVTSITFKDWWHDTKNSDWIRQYKLLSIDDEINDKIYIDRLFDFNQLNLFCNFIETIFNEKTNLKVLNSTTMVTNPPLEIIEDMQSVLKDDIIFYKSIVDAGGELIINPYRSTP